VNSTRPSPLPVKPSVYAAQWRPRADTRGMLNLKSCELQHPLADRLLADVLSGLSTHDASRYPYQWDLTCQLARTNGIEADQMLLAPGSSNAIALITDALVEPAGRLLVQEPAFDRWLHHAVLRGIPVTRCKGVEGVPPCVVTQVFVDTMLTVPPSVAVINNPGNPTGILLSVEQIGELGETAADRGHVLVIDECYGAFCAVDHLELLRRLPNLIILRSLSKSWALAGARLALVFGSAEVIGYLRRFGTDDAVSGLAVALARALCTRTDELQAIWADVVGIREEFTAAVLHDHPRWTALPSATNFVTFHTGRSGTVRHIESGLASHGIRIRGLDDVAGMSGCVRFSLASREQMRQVADCLRTLD
jgi:histidinol-phosphate aminotransferase